MPEVRNRMNNPAPEIAFQEIYLPDDKDFGTGTFRFQAKKDMLVPPTKPEPKAIAAIALNPPRFQLAVTVNPGTKEIPVLLGHAGGSDPVSRAIFLLPAAFNTSKPHEFKVTFKNWQLLSLTMNDNTLEQKK